MQVTAHFEACRQLGNQRRLNQAALVVLFLVPGVGKEDVHAVQALFGQHVVNHVNRVVGHDADVAQLLFANALEQRTHAGFMHFTAQKVFLRHHARNVRGGLAHAKTDFENDRRRVGIN